MVRVIPRFVIVPRAMRDRMVKQIEDCGWRAAYNVFDGDDLMTIHGYDWRHPKLPGSPITYPGSLVHDVCLFKGWRSRGDSSQHRRRTTLTLVRLNKIVIQLGIWADGPETPLLRSTGRPAFGLAPSPKNDMIDFDHAALGNAWGIVGDHHDIARPRRYPPLHRHVECGRIALRQDRQRLSGQCRHPGRCRPVSNRPALTCVGSGVLGFASRTNGRPDADGAGYRRQRNHPRNHRQGVRR